MILEIAVGSFLLGSFIYHRWIEYHPPGPRARDIELPRVDEGTPMPLLYGRCRVRSPIVAWSGNYRVPNGTTIDVYSLDILFVLGVPFYGGLVSVAPFTYGVFLGDIKLGTLIFTNTTPPTIVTDNGSGSPFDFQGTGEFFDGSPAQNIGGVTNTAARMQLAGISSTLIPGYRNQVCVAFVSPNDSLVSAGMHIGLNPEVRGLSFEVQSLSTGTVADMGQSLAVEADPAAVIYDLLTSPWAKLHLPTDRIDRDSFEAASLTLYNEGHGYSRAFERVEEANAMVEDVLRQIDGMIYEEPTTGKIVLKLARNDYDPNNLVDINPDNSTLVNYMVQGWSDTFNKVLLTFTQREANYNDALEIGQNEANATAQGGRVRPVDVRYVGCCTRDLAKKLASRELAVVSRPMVKATVVVNRSFYQVRPLDVVTLTRPELGVDRMIMRVARVDFGQLHAGAITLDLIRDVFDVTVGAF